MRRLLLLSTLLALAAPAAAHAAFAPKLTATITPTTPSSTAGITTVITQGLLETPQKKVVVTFPKELGINPDTTAQNCLDAQVAAKACPADTKLGSASATALGGLAHLSGTVNLGDSTEQGLKLIVFLSGSGQNMTLVGLIQFTPNGETTTFDGLPNVPVSRLQISLDNGPQTLLETPAACGTYNIRADFTSQNNETASAAAPFTISGCPPPPVAKPAKPHLSALKISPKHVTSARRGTLSFRLSKKASVLVRVKKGRRVVKRIRLAGHRGANRVRLPKLARGRYVIALTATDTGRRKGSASVKLTVAKPKAAKR